MNVASSHDSLGQDTSGATSSFTPLERTVLATAGSAFLLVGLRPRLLMDLAITGLGGYLLYRGLGGECPAFLTRLRGSDRESTRGAAEFSALVQPSEANEISHRDSPRRLDAVDEASLESFPASDPPSSIGAAATSSKLRPSS